MNTYSGWCHHKQRPPGYDACAMQRLMTMVLAGGKRVAYVVMSWMDSYFYSDGTIIVSMVIGGETQERG